MSTKYFFGSSKCITKGSGFCWVSLTFIAALYFPTPRCKPETAREVCFWKQCHDEADNDLLKEMWNENSTEDKAALDDNIPLKFQQFGSMNFG